MVGWALHEFYAAIPCMDFQEHFRVPRALFYRLLLDLKEYNVMKWSTQYGAIGRVGIDAAVTVLVCFKRPGKGASLRELEYGARMDKETIRGYMTRLFFATSKLSTGKLT